MQSLIKSIGKIFQPLLDAVGGILAFFYSIVPNYPIDVALLTILIMALLTPLTVKSTKNMAAMQALGPEMKKLQQKYKGAENRTQLNEEMMKLYKEHKVNPASGCLPMLLQMPAFLVLYDVIRGITNTVSKGSKLPDGNVCHSTVCAVPRYVPVDTKMYHDIVAAHGQLNSFGMNFADKLLSHHSSIWAAIPFLLLVAGAVGLQYLQMSRLNARNPQAAQANPQAAMLQKYMPLIFGFIYLNVAAILNIYFVISSAIRILTQEILFRKGIVGGPPPPPTAGSDGPAEKRPKSPVADRTERALPKPKTGAGGSRNGSATGGSRRPATGKSGASRPARASTPRKSAGAAGSAGGGKTGSGGGKTGANGSGPNRTRAKSPGNRSNGSNGRAAGGSAASAPQPKAHPRSKDKRSRKAR
ncbi:MAG: YidC/Oxa1 family membrane protein insertase [Acidimicrobiales bacterium]